MLVTEVEKKSGGYILYSLQKIVVLQTVYLAPKSLFRVLVICYPLPTRRWHNTLSMYKAELEVIFHKPSLLEVLLVINSTTIDLVSQSRNWMLI